MHIPESNYLYGPNIYTDKPAFWAILDVDKLAGCETNELGPEYGTALLKLLPGLKKHALEDGQAFSKFLNSTGGIPVGRALERISIELQSLAGHQSSWGKTIPLETPTTCKVIVECHDMYIYPYVLKISLLILIALLPGDLRAEIKMPANFSLKKELPVYLSNLRSMGLDLSTKALVTKAEERNIPWQRLHANFAFVQLGQGCCAKQIFETISSADNPVAIAANKNVAAQFLDKMGLPVPKQTIVSTARQAVSVARVIGYPVVIKPNQGKKGLGVTTGIIGDRDVMQAFDRASRYDNFVVVEKHVEGDDHRLLIVNGKLIAAAKRLPAHVIGDGVHTIEELVNELNLDPRRGIGFEKILVKVKLDKKVISLLKKAGFTPRSVPEKDQVVYLADTANISTGGVAVDMTDLVHPDNRYIAETAAMYLGLAVSGVDFITTDISRSWREVPGCIIEVNRCPGLRPHWIADPEKDVVGPILDMLFPENKPSRIPIAAITGSNGKTTTCQMLGHILKLTGKKCGLVTTQGIFINGRQVKSGDFAGTNGARIVYQDPRVEVAVLESARGGLLSSGLAFKQCDVGAVLNVTSEHVGLNGIQSVEEMARLKRLVVENASKAVVLNADDELCRAMIPYCSAEQICLVAIDKDSPHLQTHVAVGGHAVILAKEEGKMQIVLLDGDQTVPVVQTSKMPSTHNDLAVCNISNAMFATAIAWEMGVSPDIIGEGLRTFETTYECNPGRLNIYDDLLFRVILDFAHNPAKYKAMVEFVSSLPTNGRRIIVISPSGNRPDEVLQEIAKVCAGDFDHYFLARRAVPRKNRGEFEIQELMRDTMHECGVSPDCITVCNLETEAAEQALSFASPGDTVVLTAYDYSGCWEIVKNYKV